MDEHLRDVFDQLKIETINLPSRLMLYKQMFDTNERIKILNKTSSVVFSEFQQLIVNHMIMSLSKLTDPPKTSRQNNLSFQYLIAEVRKDNKTELYEILDLEFKELENTCKKCRHIRNKRSAHNDLDEALNRKVRPLPGVSSVEIEKALEHSRNIMNMIDRHFNKTTFLYEDLVLPLGNNGRSVLTWLQKGLAYQALEDAGEIKKGKWKELGAID